MSIDMREVDCVPSVTLKIKNFSCNISPGVCHLVETIDFYFIRISVWKIISWLKADTLYVVVVIEFNHYPWLVWSSLIPLVPCFIAWAKQILREFHTCATAMRDWMLSWNFGNFMQVISYQRLNLWLNLDMNASTMPSTDCKSSRSSMAYWLLETHRLLISHRSSISWRMYSITCRLCGISHRLLITHGLLISHRLLINWLLLWYSHLNLDRWSMLTDLNTEATVMHSRNICRDLEPVKENCRRTFDKLHCNFVASIRMHAKPIMRDVFMEMRSSMVFSFNVEMTLKLISVNIDVDLA